LVIQFEETTDRGNISPLCICMKAVLFNIGMISTNPCKLTSKILRRTLNH
jgi:hypothetical protein